MSALLQDLRYALRTLIKSPGFATAALLVLALGIGANTAIFSVVHAVLLRPLPFQDPERLVMLWHVPPPQSFNAMPKFAVSPGNYLDWKAQNRVFEQTAILGFDIPSLTGAGEPEAIVASRVESTFFHTLGVQPMMGRGFLPEEDWKDAAKVVILGEQLWRSRFAADPSVVGRNIQLNGESHLVVGIAPASLNFPSETQLYLPLAWDDKERALRSIHDYLVLARMKPGVTPAQAQTEMDTISKRLEQSFPEDNTNWGALVEPLQEARVGQARPALLMMLGAVAFVLLIACANVANLVLARAIARQKEIAIRTALGATRWRLLQQTILETVVIALGGGLLGLWLATLTTALIVNFLGPELAAIANVRLDTPVLLFTFAISVIAGVLAGLLPAMRLARTNVNDALKEGAGRAGSDTGGGRTRTVLVTAEMALSLMLLVGAALTVRSLWNLHAVNPGIDPANVLTMQVSLTAPRFEPKDARRRFIDDALARIRTLPGVEFAAVATSLPVVHGGSTQPVVIEGQPPLPIAEQPAVATRSISPGYLQTFRIPVVRGRDLTDADNERSKPVLLVSSAMAQKFWPGEDAIGKRLTLSFVPDRIWEVVGVVGDVRMEGLESAKPVPTVYTAMKQEPWPFYVFTVRTKVEPGSLIAAVVKEIHAADPLLPVSAIASMDRLLLESVAQRRFNMMLLMAFAGLALFLAAIGIYSVISYGVRRRLREIGIRMALGARPADVLRLILAEALKPTLTGMVVGVLGAVALSRVLASIVFGLSPTDPLTITAMALLLVSVGVLASSLPAYRATKVHPATILRDE